MRPKPIGAATIVITKIPPSENVTNADKKPKNGKCHKIFPKPFM